MCIAHLFLTNSVTATTRGIDRCAVHTLQNSAPWFAFGFEQLFDTLDIPCSAHAYPQPSTIMELFGVCEQLTDIRVEFVGHGQSGFHFLLAQDDQDRKGAVFRDEAAERLAAPAVPDGPSVLAAIERLGGKVIR